MSMGIHTFPSPSLFPSYAQMTRLVALAFLVSLPFEVGEEMGLLTIPMEAHRAI